MNLYIHRLASYLESPCWSNNPRQMWETGRLGARKVRKGKALKVLGTYMSSRHSAMECMTMLEWYEAPIGPYLAASFIRGVVARQELEQNKGRPRCIGIVKLECEDPRNRRLGFLLEQQGCVNVDEQLSRRLRG